MCLVCELRAGARLRARCKNVSENPVLHCLVCELWTLTQDAGLSREPRGYPCNRLFDQIGRDRKTKADKPVAIDGIKIDARSRSDASIAEKLLAKCKTVVGQMADIGINVKGAIGRRDPGQTHFGQIIEQQGEVDLVARQMAFQFVAAIKGCKRRMLGERRRREEEIADPRRRCCNQIVGRQHPAKPPSGHAEIFRKAVDDDRIGRIFTHRMGGFAIVQAVINLVRNDTNAALMAQSGNGTHFGVGNNRASRVCRAGDNHTVGRRIKGRQCSSRQLKAGVGATINLKWLQVKRAGGIAIGNIAGPRHRNPRAGRKSAIQCEYKCGRGTTGQHDLIRADGHAIAVIIMPGDTRTQRCACPISHRVLIKHMMRRFNRFGGCAGGGLAKLHMDDRTAFGLHLVCQRADSDSVKWVDPGSHEPALEEGRNRDKSSMNRIFLGHYLTLLPPFPEIARFGAKQPIVKLTLTIRRHRIVGSQAKVKDGAWLCYSEGVAKSLFQRSQPYFGQGGPASALSISQSVPEPGSWAERLLLVRAWAEEVDWVPDLGADIGSFVWLRGTISCALLCALAITLSPGFDRLPGHSSAAVSGDAWEETRALSIAPQAWGGDTGRRMAANDLVLPLGESPERPTLDLTATLGQGDGFARVLQRAGVGGAEAQQVASLVAGVTTLDDIKPGTVMKLVLGRRLKKTDARPLDALAFRARLDLSLALVREGGRMTVVQTPIAVDRTPLRIQGRVGDSIYRAARAAGAPPTAVESYIRAIASKLSLSNDIGADAKFDIIVEQARAATGEVEYGKLLYAGLLRGNRNTQLLQWNIGGRSEWFEASGVGERRGGMTQPVDGARQTSGYGMRFHPILGYNRFHQGIDFGAPHGTPIRAVTDGMVVSAGRRGGNGNWVKINHAGNLATSYSHMSRIAVSAGNRVLQGEVIGYVGSTGLSTGPHLHFETYKNGAVVNPKAVSFTGAALLSGKELANFRARLSGLLTVPLAGGSQTVASR